MPRNHTPQHYDLSDAEKRDLIALIQAGRPLPEKYSIILFADKREGELVWNGKSREVCTTILPIQTLEHINEPPKEAREDVEESYSTPAVASLRAGPTRPRRARVGSRVRGALDRRVHLRKRVVELPYP